MAFQSFQTLMARLKGEDPAPNVPAAAPSPDNMAVQIARQYLEDNDWYFDELENNRGFRIPFRGDLLRWSIYFVMSSDWERVMFVSVLDPMVPIERRSLMAEMLTRINFRIPIGSFQMDFNDGELRYDTSLEVTHFPLTSKGFQSLLMWHVASVDRFYAPIVRVALGDADPQTALEGL